MEIQRELNKEKILDLIDDVDNERVEPFVEQRLNEPTNYDFGSLKKHKEIVVERGRFVEKMVRKSRHALDSKAW